MATIARGSKTGGGTDFNVGQAMKSAEFNTDFNVIVNEINGGLDNDNIDGSAAIDYSKLDLALSIVNADVSASAAIVPTKLDDLSATDATHDDSTTPGDSASHTLPTTISGEVQQLRYALERLGLGISAGRFDATGTLEATFWGDLPVRNLQMLPGFNGTVTSGLPVGWTNVGTATLAQEAADAADGLAGKGRAIKITAAGSANEGLSYTLAGLKESTRYWFGALMKATSGDTAKMTVTGADATSSFRDLTVTTTATTWTWIFGVVQTDSTPTSLVVSNFAAADTDIVWTAGVVFGECAAVPIAPRVAVVRQMIAATAGTTITGGITDAGLAANYQFIDNGTTDLDMTVYVPGDGYYIHVTAAWWAQDAVADAVETTFTVRLMQSVAGGALSYPIIRHHAGTHDGANNKQEVHQGFLDYMVEAPTPGASYRFGLIATSSGAQDVTPQLANAGYSSLGVRVLPYGG